MRITNTEEKQKTPQVQKNEIPSPFPIFATFYTYHVPGQVMAHWLPGSGNKISFEHNHTCLLMCGLWPYHESGVKWLHKTTGPRSSVSLLGLSVTVKSPLKHTLQLCHRCSRGSTTCTFKSADPGALDQLFIKNPRSADP